MSTSFTNTNAGRPPRRTAVVGLGNDLLGDDGFGPLAVEMFRSLYECDSNVEILDPGTPGLDLSPYLYNTDLVVIADAIYPHKEEKPGTLCVYCEDDLGSSHAQLRLTSHDPGVQESLVQLRLAGHAPSEVIVVGVVPESCGLGRGISLSVLKPPQEICEARRLFDWELSGIGWLGAKALRETRGCLHTSSRTPSFAGMVIEVALEPPGIPAVAPNVRLAPLSVETEMGSMEVASRVFPPFARPDFRSCLWIVFTSAAGFILVLSFRSEPALCASFRVEGDSSR